jgi:hypothetical protein
MPLAELWGLRLMCAVNYTQFKDRTFLMAKCLV